MNNRATVIIVPPSAPDGPGLCEAELDPVATFSALQTTVNRVLASQLPLILVAPRAITDQVRSILPHNCLVDTPAESSLSAASLARAVAAGVLASAQADGWLVLPGDMPMLRADTLKQVSDAVQTYPIAYAQYQARRGHPMGFGKELFSELMHLDTDRDLHRLTSRYPAEGIDVDDPGVVMHNGAGHDVSMPSSFSAGMRMHS